jgi:hypothetical protein
LESREPYGEGRRILTKRQVLELGAFDSEALGIDFVRPPDSAGHEAPAAVSLFKNGL